MKHDVYSILIVKINHYSGLSAGSKKKKYSLKNIKIKCPYFITKIDFILDK
jgi:hypothetical protein